MGPRGGGGGWHTLRGHGWAVAAHEEWRRRVPASRMALAPNPCNKPAALHPPATVTSCLSASASSSRRSTTSKRTSKRVCVSSAGSASRYASAPEQRALPAPARLLGCCRVKAACGGLALFCTKRQQPGPLQHAAPPCAPLLVRALPFGTRAARLVRVADCTPALLHPQAMVPAPRLACWWPLKPSGTLRPAKINSNAPTL